MREARVLVVDDEHDARDMLHAILTAAGASVIEASSAQEALVLLSDAAPDVLISDIGMAAEDGYAFIRQVRALPGELARVPAVALTAYGHAADRAHAPALHGGRDLRSRQGAAPALVAHLQGGQHAPLEVGRQVAADRLHLGQLGHARELDSDQPPADAASSCASDMPSVRRRTRSVVRAPGRPGIFESLNAS